jgi:hypothetical protein
VYNLSPLFICGNEYGRAYMSWSAIQYQCLWAEHSRIQPLTSICSIKWTISLHIMNAVRRPKYSIIGCVRGYWYFTSYSAPTPSLE